MSEDAVAPVVEPPGAAADPLPASQAARDVLKAQGVYEADSQRGRS